MASSALAKIFGMWSRPLSLAVLLAFCGTGTQVFAADSNLLVEEAVGAVKLRMSDRWETPVSGTAVVLPAVVSTGDDGSARLRQNEIVISVAANTAIELLDNPGSGLLQRAVQDRGSAFYDIAPQGSSRFRVETPFLVAVIKGTQFNVTVSDDVSSVSLFEGQLRIEAPDVGDAVDLTAGQIAQRRKGDLRITVLSMENGEPVSRNNVSKPGSSVSANNDRNTRGPTAVDAGDAGDEISVSIGSNDDSVIGSSGTTVTADGSIRLDDKELDAALESNLGVGELAKAALGVESSIDLESGEMALSAQQTLDLGGSSIDTGLDAGVDLGDGQVDLGVDSALDLGESSIEVGLDAGIDLDSGIDLNLDLGSTGELLDVDLGIDLLGDAESSTEVESDDTDTLLPNLGNLLGL
jgi:hypothetical protein